MSYQHFIGALGAPHTITGSQNTGVTARAHLSLVPDPVDVTTHGTGRRTVAGARAVRADRP